MWIWVGALALIPASEFAVALMHRVVHRIARPWPLPRLDLRGGVPEPARTMVIVPTLISSAQGARALAEHLEVHALGNLDPRIHFALLTDFPDAPSERLPGEDQVLAAAIEAIEALNARYAPGTGDRFYLFHRARRWNGSEGCGWGGSASAGRSRSSTGCCGGPPTRASPCGSAIPRSCRASATASRSTATPACRATRRGS
jgi:cyclic beta-1,2-glucan synthetase